MKKYYELEELDEINKEDVLNSINENIKELRARIKRLGRSDKGKKRSQYSNNLPPRYKSYIMRANKNGIEFEFTIEEFENMCKTDCYYCGDSGYGIDRVNSKLGYTKDNCVPCCAKCNMMKYTLNQKDFINMCKKIYYNTQNK